MVWVSDSGSWRIVEVCPGDDRPWREGSSLTYEQVLQPDRFVIEQAHRDAMGDMRWRREPVHFGLVAALARSLTGAEVSQ